MKLMKHFLHLLLISVCHLLLVTGFSACKPDVPDDVLSTRQMEDVLYDYHIAQALAEETHFDSAAYYTRLYSEAVFAKHGIDKTQFDRSMVYYESHTKLLTAIYKRLAQRFGEPTTADPFRNTIDGVNGDTLNLWQGTTFALLQSNGQNRFCFSIPVDTTVQSGDDLELHFEAEWFYHDGERSAAAVLTVHYDADSVRTVNTGFFANGHVALSVRIGDRPIRSIDGFIYQDTPWAQRPRILSLKQMSLYRIRPKQADPAVDNAETTDADTLSRLRPANQKLLLRDSLLRRDTLERRRSHFK